MIIYAEGNLLQAEVEAIVNTVNCVGVMGKGIALQFKQAFPDNFRIYAQACKAGEVQAGRMLLVEREGWVNPRFIINFPTKVHWKNPSRLEHIELGLVDLVRVIQDNNIQSIAIPALGCGNGGLDWGQVQPLIEQALASLPNLVAYVYAPQSAPAAESMPVATTPPNMTRARALFIKLIEQYSLPGYRLSYQKHIFGPYAENLNHVLQRIEGHFIRGYGDRSKDAQIQLMPDAVAQANDFLAHNADANQRLLQVKSLIEGFETPYGMELLASVHWVSQQQMANDVEQAIKQIKSWNARKAKVMQDKHIAKAFTRLREQGWI